MEEKLVNIKLDLKKARVTQTTLAKILKVSPVAVHWVVVGKKRTSRIRMAIALALGKKVEDIEWPEYKPSKKSTKAKPASESWPEK